MLENLSTVQRLSFTQPAFYTYTQTFIHWRDKKYTLQNIQQQ